MSYTGILLGEFNGHDDVVMERCCIERATAWEALKDAQHLKLITDGADDWVPAIENNSGEVQS